MSYGWKHLNLNTADPWIISGIIGDYLTIGDHETLKSMGLTQSIINELEEGTPFFEHWWTYNPKKKDKPKDLITSGRIDPSRDLNIPGDLFKWQFWNLGDVPEEKYNGGSGQGRRTWVNERRQNLWNQNLNEGVANGSIRLVPEEAATFTPRTMLNTFVHPSLTKFETAPSVNRLLSLFNAYGGDRSFIMTGLMGFSNRGLGTLGFSLFDPSITGVSPPPELANYPIPSGIPFGQRAGDNFYYNWMMKNAYNGTYSGYNYGRMRQVWAEGRSPYVAQSIDPDTETWYGRDEVSHDWGLEDKIQVPAYYRQFRGGRDPGQCHYEIRYSWDYCPTGFNGSDYGSGEEFRFAIVRNPDDPGEIKTQLPSGLIVTEKVNNTDGATPFLEWPDVWDGNVYRPAKCPITNFTVFGDREGYIEFLKEVSEHAKAINEWFNDGCPCDWQDYGGYVDPTVAAEAAVTEAAAVSAATQYVPTSTTSATPPLNPKFGDLWRDSATGKTKTFVQTSATTGTWADA